MLKNVIKNSLGWLLLLIYLSNKKTRPFFISLCRINQTLKNKMLSILRSAFQDVSYYHLPLKQRMQFQIATTSGESGLNWMKPKPEESPFPPQRGEQVTGDMDFCESRPFVAEINSVLENKNIKTLLQIGCGTGTEIAYFAKTYPELLCIGTEIIEDLIPHLESTWEFNNLKFIRAYSHEILERLEQEKDMIIFSNGTLQYVQPEHLQVFFNQFAQRKDCHLILCESANFRKKEPNEINGSMARVCFSWTHNYDFYARLNHCKIIRTTIIKPFKDIVRDKNHRFTCHYFAHYST